MLLGSPASPPWAVRRYISSPPKLCTVVGHGAKTYHGSLLLHPALVCEVPATEADPKAATTRARHMMSVGRIVVLL